MSIMKVNCSKCGSTNVKLHPPYRVCGDCGNRVLSPHGETLKSKRALHKPTKKRGK
jgi:uncharacterized OB-fold protein